MQVAVISVGTELTNGQIVNKNAAWISKQLKDLGVPTTCHLVVPDDRPLILKALRFCADECNTIFVTGGLGPTTDDFTRELISEWTQAPLEFHEPSWIQIQNLLKSRGLEVRESQRQQAMFPRGAKVLFNPEGTANGFQIKFNGKDVFVLPGPPNEIAAVWKDNLADLFLQKTKGLNKHVTFSWDTMGLGESDVSHLTENCLRGVQIEKGYRVHLPYVEVKLTFLESEKEKMWPFVEKVDEALRHITITRNGEEVPHLIAQKLTAVQKIQVVDALSGQGVLNRLVPALRNLMKESSWSFTNENDLIVEPQTLKMILKPWDSTTAVAEIHYRGASFKTIFEAPFMISKLSERKSLYFAERALIFWLQKLEDLL